MTEQEQIKLKVLEIKIEVLKSAYTIQAILMRNEITNQLDEIDKHNLSNSIAPLSEFIETIEYFLNPKL